MKTTLSSMRDLQDKLHLMHKQYQTESSENSEEENTVRELIDGVQVNIKYEGSNRNTDYSTVLLDGYHFARECETIPWSVFKSINISYVCFTFLSEPTLKELLKSLGLTKQFVLVEEWYPADDKVLRYNCATKDLKAVITLWKSWKEKYLNESYETKINE